MLNIHNKLNLMYFIYVGQYAIQCTCVPKQFIQSAYVIACLQGYSAYPEIRYIRGRVDESLARPGRKQATATKIGIYSTNSPRSSIHFLVHCSNFCKPLKKEFRKLFFQVGLREKMTSASEKMANFNCFFQSREYVIVRRGQMRRIG